MTLRFEKESIKVVAAGIKRQRLAEEKEKIKERVKEKARRHHLHKPTIAGSKLPKDIATDRTVSSVVKEEIKVKDRQRFRLQYNKRYSSMASAMASNGVNRMVKIGSGGHQRRRSQKRNGRRI